MITTKTSKKKTLYAVLDSDLQAGGWSLKEGSRHRVDPRGRNGGRLQDGGFLLTEGGSEVLVPSGGFHLEVETTTTTTVVTKETTVHRVG